MCIKLLIVCFVYADTIWEIFKREISGKLENNILLGRTLCAMLEPGKDLISILVGPYR